MSDVDATIGIVPYVVVPLTASEGPYQGQLPITEVYHGPSEYGDAAGPVLTRLLEEHGYAAQKTTVKAARAPLRV